MRRCLRCGDAVEDGLDTCSNCGAVAGATVNPYAYEEPAECAPGDNLVAVELGFVSELQLDVVSQVLLDERHFDHAAEVLRSLFKSREDATTFL